MRIKDILEGRASAIGVNDAFSEIMGQDAYDTPVRNLIDQIRAKEALAPSDFPLLFADTLDRILVKGYQETPQTYKSIVKISTVPDFRNVKRYNTYGGDGRLEAVLPDGEYPIVPRHEAKYEFGVSKYGKRFDINWESFVNDDLSALKDQPERFGRGARRSEQHFATSLWAANSSLYTSGQANKGTAALSIASLTAGCTAMRLMRDEGGEPIFNRPKFLVVPPQLENTAKNILNSTTIWWLQNASATVPSSPTAVPATNSLPDDLTLIVDDYLPIVDTVNGATGWYLFADPSFGYSVEVGFLRGHETPRLFMKSSNAVAIGGGAATSPFEGSFETDSMAYKVRHVWGGTTTDYRFTYHSDGTT